MADRETFVGKRESIQSNGESKPSLAKTRTSLRWSKAANQRSGQAFVGRLGPTFVSEFVERPKAFVCKG